MNRRNILARIGTLMGLVTGVVTVVRSYDGIDPTQYAESAYPIVDIHEPGEENEDELTSMRSMQFLKVVLSVHFVSWGIDPSSTYESLMKNIRDEIGGDFELNGESTATWITDVSLVDSELFPLYSFDIGLMCKYYLNLQAT